MKPHVTVMGSFIVDLMARAPRLPVHGETVKGSHFQIGPGGKGSNQGVAAARAGAEVTMITKIGADAFAQIALDSFRREGMHDRYVMQDERYPTGTALIMVDENTSENQILVTIGACAYIEPAEIEAAREHIEGSAVLLTQLETNLEAVEQAIQIAHAKGRQGHPEPRPGAPAPPARRTPGHGRYPDPQRNGSRGPLRGADRHLGRRPAGGDDAQGQGCPPGDNHPGW